MRASETVAVSLHVGPRPENISPLHWMLHRERVERIAACFDHDLVGPASERYVYATCSKCEGMFKVRIERDS